MSCSQAAILCVMIHSILLTNGSVTVQELRELVAGIILSDPDKFSTVMLGRSNEEYAEWIMKGESWGGMILHGLIVGLH